MKHNIRNQIKNRLKELVNKESAAKKILSNIQPLIDSVSTVAIYHANGCELNLDEVIRYCLSKGKKLYQPVSYRHSKQMLLMQYNANYVDIFSPQEFIPNNTYEWYNLDLILLPLIAVDKRGYRLGKGGGYYDATLANVVQGTSFPILCGIGFDVQLVEQIPNDNWDIRLNYFASECRLIKFERIIPT